MMSCGMYSVHTNRLTEVEVSVALFCGAGQLKPVPVVLPLGCDTKAAAALVDAVVGANVAGAVVGAAVAGAVVGASVAGAVVGPAVGAVVAATEGVSAPVAATVVGAVVATGAWVVAAGPAQATSNRLRLTIPANIFQTVARFFNICLLLVDGLSQSSRVQVYRSGGARPCRDAGWINRLAARTPEQLGRPSIAWTPAHG